MDKESVPYIVHERDMARLERGNRRLLIALAISVVVLLLNNIAWLIHVEHSQKTQEYTIESEP